MDFLTCGLKLYMDVIFFNERCAVKKGLNLEKM